METKTNFEKSIEILKSVIENTEFKNKIYLVGGAVRDLQLGLNPKDIDLVIDVPDGEIKFKKFLENKEMFSGFVEYPRFRTLKFSLNLENCEKEDIEVVVPRTEVYNEGPRKPSKVEQTTLEKDALRRDFCCNALYMNISSGEIIDPTGKGILDCKNKILRTPVDPKLTFKEDPLRMLRAIRFSCQKGFKIDNIVLSSISDIDEFYRLSKERIRDEFVKIIMSRFSIEGLELLRKTGLMNGIIPKLVEYYSFNQNSKYHNLTWYDHTMKVYELVVKDGNASLELRLSALLHDISKPITYTINEKTGYFNFIGHEESSAKEAEEILKNLKFSNTIINKVTFLVKNHMIIKPFYDYDLKKYTGKPKKTRQIIRECGDNLYDLMKLIEADNMSHHPDYCLYNQVKSFYEEVEKLKLEEKTIIPLPINGNDIMKQFKIPAGPEIGKIISKMQELFDEDPKRTKEDLIRLYKEGK